MMGDCFFKRGKINVFVIFSVSGIRLPPDSTLQGAVDPPQALCRLPWLCGVFLGLLEATWGELGFHWLEIPGGVAQINLPMEVIILSVFQ